MNDPKLHARAWFTDDDDDLIIIIIIIAVLVNENGVLYLCEVVKV